MIKRTTVSTLCGGCLVIVLWQIAAQLVHRELIVPKPVTVFSLLGNNIMYYCSISARTALYAGTGLAVASLLSLCVGVAVALWKRAEAILPFMVTVKATPAVVFAPIFAAIFGSGYLVKCAVAALIALFPIVVSTIEGVRQTPAPLRTLGLSYGASPWRALRYLGTCYLFSGWLNGIQSAAPLAVIGAIVAEFVDPSNISNGGVGMEIAMRKGTSMPGLYAATLCSVLVGIISFWTMHIVARSYQQKRKLAK